MFSFSTSNSCFSAIYDVEIIFVDYVIRNQYKGKLEYMILGRCGKKKNGGTGRKALHYKLWTLPNL